MIRSRVGWDIVAHQESAEDIRVRRVREVLEEPIVPGDDAPVSHSQDDPYGIIAIASVANRVGVTATDEFDRLWFLELGQPLQRISDLGGLLEVQLRGRAIHALSQTSAHINGATLEKREYIVDHFPVFGCCLVSDTRSTASLDMVVQARAFHGIPGEVVVARPDGEDPSNDPQRAAQDTDVRVGAKESGAGYIDTTDDQDARERLPNCNGDARVTLVIAEADIERWPVFLDEVVLEQQRLRIRGDNDGFEVGDLPPQHEIFRSDVRIGGEVLSDPGPQATGFSDIEHLAGFIFPEVHARRVRERRELRRDPRGDIGHAWKLLGRGRTPQDG